MHLSNSTEKIKSKSGARLEPTTYRFLVYASTDLATQKVINSKVIHFHLFQKIISHMMEVSNKSILIKHSHRAQTVVSLKKEFVLLIIAHEMEVYTGLKQI